MLKTSAAGPLWALAGLAAGCGNSAATGGSGGLRVVVQAEESITSGIAAGEGAEDIHDGWSVGFDKYIAVLGDIELHLATDETAESKAPELFAVDLAQAPSAGFLLWEFEGLHEGRYEFFYALGAGSAAQQHDSVSAEDFARLTHGDLTYLISGLLQKSGGLSCPPVAWVEPGEKVPVSVSEAGENCFENPVIAFEIAVPAATTFGPCEIDGLSGTVVSPDKVQTAAITLHGDHLFFNGFPEGSEGGVVRTAQWLADCDLDLDGTVTQRELETLSPADLAEFEGVQLGGSPLTPIDSMWTYVTAQLETQGHFEGEGECAIDGQAHDHAGE